MSYFKKAMFLTAIFCFCIFILSACRPEKVVKCKCKIGPTTCDECEDECDDDTDDDADDDDTEDDIMEGWEWMDIDGTQCRNGSSSGIAVRFSETGSDKLAIYLEATGICFIAGQCDEAMDHFNAEVLRYVLSEGYLKGGLFNREQEANPAKDWNQVYVPGCTGDMMAGNNPDGFAFSMPGSQHYVGYMNLQKIVPRLQEIFEGQLSRILLWGMCSGGNATLAAYPLVADAFPDIPVTMLNDSGPIGAMDEAFAPCEQRMLRIMFNINPSLPEGCTDCTLPRGDGLSNILPYLANHYSKGTFGLMCQTEDEALRTVWGMGQDYCMRYLFAEDEDDLLLPPDIFREALIDMRDNYLLPTGRWTTFYAAGEAHTFGLIDDWIYEDMEEYENPVLAWARELIEGGLPDPVHFEE